MKRIAPRTYQDKKGRYWARFPVHGRYTWKLLRDVTTKRDAIAEAQSATAPRADSFTALSQLYVDAGCPNRRMETRPAYFVKEETARVVTLQEWFGNFTADEIRLPLIPKYAAWRMRRCRTKHGCQRAVDKDLNTLSNVLQYGIVIQAIEQNHIRYNRPRYRKTSDVIHCRTKMPEDADTIHEVCDYLLSNSVRSEVFAWMTLFQMFTGCRTSELLRLRLDAPAGSPGHRADGHLHLGRRSKSGVNPFIAIGDDFARMLQCFDLWHRSRHPRHKPYFPSPFGSVTTAKSHGHALRRVCESLNIPHITPHGLRAYYVTKRRRDGAHDAVVASEIGDKTVTLIATTYGDIPGGKLLTWKPGRGLPSWDRWLPEQAKIARIA